jgi:hypothetical protein
MGAGSNGAAAASHNSQPTNCGVGVGGNGTNDTTAVKGAEGCAFIFY